MLTRTQLEHKVIRIAERVLRGIPNEDSLVELKTKWPEPTDKKRYEFSRQIAAHANAAGGNPLLWVIGIDEKNHAVPGATDDELAVWLDIFRSHFDGLSPDMLNNLAVPVGEVSVVALYFDTSRAPYVLDGTDIVKPGKEVPWRVGNQTGTARREDLIRLLTPIEALPEIEPIHCSLSAGGRHSALELSLMFEMYVYAPTGRPVTFPLHKCRAHISNTRSDGKARLIPMTVTRIAASSHRFWKRGTRIESKTVVESASETIVNGAGMIALSASIDAKVGKFRKNIEAIVSMWAYGAHREVRLRETMGRSSHSDDELPQWTMKRRDTASSE